MKKSLYILFAAALAMASASCAREEIFENEQAGKEVRTFTCSFDGEAQTKTNITKQGKTVWAEGDMIYVSNGTEADTLTVDSKYAGQKYFEFSTTLEGKIYVVYPVSAVAGIAEDGKISVNIPNVQNGTFGSANIACAVAEDRYVKLKNVTAVLRFKVAADAAAPVKVVSINSVGDKVTGTVNVDLSTGSPVVSTIEGNSYSSDVTVSVDGSNGNSFYASVIPGTYKAGFSMSAVTLDLKNAKESRTTVSDKEIKVNGYYDLGTIGAELQPLDGDGSQNNPWQINDLPALLAVAYYVNEGHTMAGEYVKLTDNIKNMTASIGYYDAALNVKKQFKGDFDGNGKIVSLNINQTGKRSCGLFGAVADSANVHNVIVDGTVTSTFDDAAGVCGLANGGKSTYFTNCTSKATVKSTANYAAGIIGWADGGFVIESCSNEGDVTGSKSVGGIVGSLRNSYVKNSKNSGNIEVTANNGGISDNAADLHGVGGIAGFANGSTVSDCTNSGAVKCLNKGGGIVGHGSWFTVKDCRNTGHVSSSQYGVNAGIVGSAWDNVSVLNCVNDGEISGTFKSGWIGGIVGSAQSAKKTGVRRINIKNCVNNGKINVAGAEGATQGVGGIVGYSWSYSNAPNRVEIYYCTNNGEVTVTGKEGGTEAQSGVYVGGIAGLVYDYNSWTMIPIYNCLNTANVYGGRFVGGVVGGFQGRTTGSRIDVYSCENRGNVRTETDRVGGILGGQVTTQTRAGLGAKVENCLNTGNVQYSRAGVTAPYVGGIVGIHTSGRIYNCYNGGTLGLAEGTPAEGVASTIGGIVGKASSSNAECSYSYYLETVCDNAAGTSSVRKPTEANVFSAAADGTLKGAVTISGKSYVNVVDALNALSVANANWYSWTTGPKFSFTGNFGIGDGLDLGNGGKL
jgi:hypothetical protein